MVDSYKILYKGGSGELVEKKSRFIADLRPVASEEEALEYIEEIRKKYWDARHHCFAYIIGDRGQSARCSDDGEPSQTAGKPMMDVLAGEELHDVCAVVTRYFGGTLLGTGGLVKAYGGGVHHLLIQLLGVVCIAGWAIVCDLILFTILKKTVGVRVSEREELEGLDATEHGLETGYAGFLMDKDN